MTNVNDNVMDILFFKRERVEEGGKKERDIISKQKKRNPSVWMHYNNIIIQSHDD